MTGPPSSSQLNARPSTTTRGTSSQAPASSAVFLDATGELVAGHMPASVLSLDIQPAELGADPVLHGRGHGARIVVVCADDLESVAGIGILLRPRLDARRATKQPVAGVVAAPVGAHDDLGRRGIRQAGISGELRDAPIVAAVADRDVTEPDRDGAPQSAQRSVMSVAVCTRRGTLLRRAGSRTWRSAGRARPASAPVRRAARDRSGAPRVGSRCGNERAWSCSTGRPVPGSRRDRRARQRGLGPRARRAPAAVRAT